jgi:hypothetical protein
MSQSQGSGPAPVGARAVRRQSSTAAVSSVVPRSPQLAAVSRWRSGCFPVSAARVSRWARSVAQAGFGGESGNVVVGLVELCDGLGSEELLGPDVEAVDVTLDRLEKPGRRVVQLAQEGAGGDRHFIAGEDLLQCLGRRAR